MTPKTLMLHWPDGRLCNKNSFRQKDIDLKSRNAADKVGFKDNQEADFSVLFCPLNKCIHTHEGYSYITKVTKLFWGQDWADSAGERALFLQGSGCRRKERARSKVQCVQQFQGPP